MRCGGSGLTALVTVAAPLAQLSCTIALLWLSMLTTSCSAHVPMRDPTRSRSSFTLTGGIFDRNFGEKAALIAVSVGSAISPRTRAIPSVNPGERVPGEAACPVVSALTGAVVDEGNAGLRVADGSVDVTAPDAQAPNDAQALNENRASAVFGCIVARGYQIRGPCYAGARVPSDRGR